MNAWKKRCCGAAAAVLCLTAFTGCGDDKKKDNTPMDKYNYKAHVTRMNSEARTLSVALKSASGDLAAEDMDFRKLAGEYRMTGKDFEKYQAPDVTWNQDQIRDAFLKRVYTYDPDVVKLDEIAFELSSEESFLVESVAVSQKYESTGDVFYGLVVHESAAINTPDINRSLHSMDDAVAELKKHK